MIAGISSRGNIRKKTQSKSFISSSIFEILFYVAVFFPYIAIFPVPTDTQPNALILSFVYVVYCLFVKKASFPRAIMSLMTVAVFATMFVFADAFSFTAVRSYLGYVSLIVISLASYFFVSFHGFSDLALKIIIWIWFLGAALQYLISPSILDFVVGGVVQRIGIAGGRGVSSFAVEPTYYGTVCYFLLLLVFMKLKTHRPFYSLLLLFQIVILAKSSMIILVLIVDAVFILVVLKRFKLLVVAALILVLFAGPLGSFIVDNSNSRVAYFINLVKHKGINSIFFLDASGNQRMSHIYYSLYGFAKDFGWPHGFSSWPEFYMENVHVSQYFWYTSYFPTRIMSFFGGIMFELGWLGLIIPSLIFGLILKTIKSNLKAIMCFAISLILFTAVPVTFPIVGFFIGLLMSDLNSKVELQTDT